MFLSMPANKTVSMRLPEEVYNEVERLAEVLCVDKTDIMRRLIIEGVDGLLQAEGKLGQDLNWPRKGKLRMRLSQ